MSLGFRVLGEIYQGFGGGGSARDLQGLGGLRLRSVGVGFRGFRVYLNVTITYVVAVPQCRIYRDSTKKVFGGPGDLVSRFISTLNGDTPIITPHSDPR